MRYRLGVVLVVSLFVAAGCATNYSKLRGLAEGPQMPESYPIGSRDLVMVEYRLNPELDRELTIGPHGKVDLPLIGEVMLAGKTTQQASAELTELYKAHFTTPDVSVSLVRYASKTVYILGEVPRQGAFVLDKPARLLDVIAEAGGPTLRARNRRIQLTRPDREGGEVYFCSLERLRDEGDVLHNPVLQDQDIIYVPPTPFYAVGYKTNEIMYPITSVFTGIARTVAGARGITP